MVVHQVFPIRARATSRPPLGTIAAISDLAGLVVATILLARSFPLAEFQEFYYLLVGASIIAWLAFAQLKPGLRRFGYHTYRFLAVPATAAGSSFVLADAFGQAHPEFALLPFAAGWTLWIATGRYTVRRLSPPLRTLCVGSGQFCSELDRHPHFATYHFSSVPSGYDSWDLVVYEDKALADPRWQRWLVHADMAGIQIVSAPAAREMISGRVPLEALDEQLAAGLFKRNRSYLFWKRVIDLMIVLLAAPLIVLSCLAVALVLLFDSGRPVLFSQLRVGRDGKPFRIYKFRTMKNGADKEGAVFASHGDPRVTRIGSLLRKFRLDELPQFWNVLQGDMSVIGPRPEQVDFVREFTDEIPFYELRHWVPPGITGWAQVSQGYAASAEETRVKLSYDLYYVKHCSLALDVSIVLHTCRTILTGFGSR